jgi:hypothetical protein
MNTIHKALFTLLVFLLFSGVLSAQDTWPRQIPYAGGGTITIYQPQPEKFAGDELESRAAVSIRRKSSDEPVFGAMWVKVLLSADAGDLVTVRKVTVLNSRFAEDEDINSKDFKESVEKGLQSLNIRFSKESLSASIKQEEGESNFNNDPPQILYRDRPTTLIVLDGEPTEEKDDDLGMVRVVNTPYLILKNPGDKRYYLYGGSFWYSSGRVKEGWAHVKSLPSSIKAIDKKMKEEEKKAEKQNDAVSQFTTPTDILVVTEPAELIQTEGKPTYQSVPNSSLLYVNNSLDEIFKDIDTQKNYILIAGRWYRSTSLNGPWDFVPQNDLPKAFAAIPAGSEKDGVLASVAGTDEAYDAVMEAQIPQTAKVDRNTAQVEVNYDGSPQFEVIPNTSLAIAENSNITVMRTADNRFFALENGIWFIANGAFGPWRVANERPSDVDRIPPNNSAYNARYVHIYESTPQYVYVGYTRGYMGNYIYGPTVVWGTGWRYRPWRGRYYRPRPATWGFGMHYNPWTGWSMSFGLGFNVGWYHYGYSRPYYGGGWFGPPAFRPPHRPWGWNGGYYGDRGNSRPGYGNRPRPAVTVNLPRNGDGRPSAHYANPGNLYRDRKYVVATRDNVYVPARRPSTRPNPGNGITTGTGRPGNQYERPGSGNTRPPLTRPGSGNSRPGIPDREVTRPPVTRPGTGSGDRRPSIPDREVTRPVTRPGSGAGNSRPGGDYVRPNVTRPSTRPGNPQQGTRPEISRPVTRPNVERPSTGGRQNARPAVTPERNSRPAPSRQTPRTEQPARNPAEGGSRRGNQ